ncbi:heavy metal sensor histidine kinase [Propionivibrio soli]|uniref:heavy metal sensor histidine kinase n=1 Tax=Propionivibrio soli TaxID=2976531 RepID=UPI0021E7B80C
MRPVRGMSITLRLTALFAVGSTIVLLVLGYLIGGSVERHFEEQDLDVLIGKLKLTQRMLEKVRSSADLDHLAQQLDDSLVGHEGLAVVVKIPNDQLIFATSGADFPRALLEKPLSESEALRPVVWQADSGRPFRGVVVRTGTGIEGAPQAIVGVAIDISHHRHFMASFRVTLWSFVAFAAVLTGFLGWLAVRRGLAPLQAIRKEAAAVTAHRLDARIAEESVPAELADLARTLNDMLSRLEASFRRLSDFSSDLAHEFRTPVSNLLTQTQVMLSRPRSVDEYRDVLASNVEEFERLSRMIADMLFIAKADEGQIVPTREALCLAGLVDELAEFHRLAAEDKGVELACSGDGVALGDSLMLRRAISNLLSNAIRHTPPGGRVSVTVRSPGGRRVTVDIANTGETIPPEHLPRLFDRFYRADPARSGDGGQSGLGLAIVKSIAEAHGGSVSVVSEEGVTRFTLTLATA